MPALAIGIVTVFAARALGALVFLVAFLVFFAAAFFVAVLPAVFVARAILGTPMGLKMRRLSSAMLYRKGLL